MERAERQSEMLNLIISLGFLSTATGVRFESIQKPRICWRNKCHSAGISAMWVKGYLGPHVIDKEGESTL